MWTEDEKRVFLVDSYSFKLHSLAEMGFYKEDYFEYVHACVDFVRYLPNWSHSDIYWFKNSKVKPEIAEPFQKGYGDGKWFLSDLDATAYILYDERIPTWIKADVARVFTIKIDRQLIIRMLAYNNVHMQRRKRWGVFA